MVPSTRAARVSHNRMKIGGSLDRLGIACDFVILRYLASGLQALPITPSHTWPRTMT